MASLTAHARSNTMSKKVHGLEVPNHIAYQEWEPGGTYTKSLMLKNIKLKAQKIKFSIRSKNFFCEPCQHPVVLSAGNTIALPVTFKPKGKNEIADEVQISTLEGDFTVPLIATLPRPNISVPSSIQLGLCEVENEISVSFNITNNSRTMSISFHWEYKAPFQITPSNGTLNPRESVKIQATFRPSLACIYKDVAVCHYNEEYTEKIHLEGTGKFPHLVVKESSNESSSGDEVMLSFGKVALGTECAKSIDLVNVSQVPVTFKIVAQGHTQPVYRCTRTHGTIQPLGSLAVKVICAPNFTDQRTIGHFIVKVKGGLASTKITCTAQLIGPQVVVDNDCIDFGNIECGRTSFAFLHLTNLSQTPSFYQFQIDPQSVFEVCKPIGIIKGEVGAKVTVKIAFNPRKPIPYHRSITCLVLNQESIVVDFIGSAFSETIKPARISQEQVYQYRVVAPLGLSKLSPQYLLECIENGSLHVSEEGNLIPDTIFHPPIDTLAPPVLDSSLSSNHESDPYFSHHFLLEADNMQFGFASPHRSSEGKILTITNLTEGSVMCSWMTGNDDVFQVVPRDREIPAQSTGAFAISFWPKEHNNVFCSELECYIFHKALADSTLVDSRVLIPPWCLTTTVSGHSFPPNIDPFQPNITFNSNTLILPDTVPGRPSYRSFVIHSHCDTPTLYNFDNDNQQFHIKPNYGLLKERSSAILVAEFMPSNVQHCNDSIKCTFNSDPSFTKSLNLKGVSESPRLVIDKKESMYFKPTCVGGSSESVMKITNPCGLPLRFAWQVKGPTNECLKIAPRAGTLLPNECVSIALLFAPREAKEYEFATVVSSLLCINDESLNSAKYRIPLHVYGEGTQGNIQCLNPEINCGHIAIGKSLKVSVKLKNTSTCTLKIRVGATQVIEIPDEPRETVLHHNKPKGLEFVFNECEIQPLTEKLIPVTLRPAKPATYTSNIFYQLVLTNEELDKDYHDLCTVSVTGTYPTLSVTDVLGEGVASVLSKSQIWKMLQLSSINHHLCEDPSLSELRYTISTRHSITRKPPVLTPAVLDFNFCPGPFDNAAHSTYYLMIENPGHIETEWAFKFPMDLYMEPEFWAETGKIDPVEQHETDVVKNSIFSIHPKDGTLNPGESVMVKLTYSHSHTGTNRLPVLLKINRGREIMLNFIGITSSPGSPCVSLTSHTHTFTPMPLDMLVHPIQVYELYNAGDVEGSYVIDTSTLEDLRVSNYNNPILQCLHPNGILSPRQTTKIDFIFSPLEAKTYTVDLAIHFTNGHTDVVTFIGEGVMNDQRSIMSRQANVNITPGSTDLTSPTQLVKLSQDKLDLKDMPLFAVIQCIVFMRNISTSTVSYKWNLQQNQIINIHPSSGFIQPWKSAQLRVTFHSESKPTFYNTDIVCLITNESEMTLYKQDLDKFQTIDVKKSDEFIITDKKSFTRRPQSNEETYEEWKKKDMSRKSKARARKVPEKLAEAPIPPKPQFSHLGIVGNTYSIPDYCRLHGSQFDSFKIDYNSIMTKATSVARNEEGMVNIFEAELSIVENTLVECLRDLEKDTNFLASIQAIANESIPYFSQFTMRQSSAADLDPSIRDNASRHVYAAGLEHIPSLTECTEPEESVLVEHSDYEGQEEGEEERGESPVISSSELSKPPPSITNLKGSDTVGMKIKRSTEFQSFTDIVLENVLLNVIKEVNKGEVSLTAPVYTIVKPP